MEELDGEEINREDNMMSLENSMHTSFGDLSVWLDAVEVAKIESVRQDWYCVLLDRGSVPSNE